MMKKILPAFLFIIASLLTFSLPHAETSVTAENKILYYQIDDSIHGGTVEILEKIFTKAKEENFHAILIQLDTPGGLLDSTEDIVKMFLNAEIPVIVYVAPSGARAGSAGTFITLAAHVAAMAPGTYIGAAHPVMMFGGGGKEGDTQQEIMNKKIESAASTYIETIAETRSRNKEWAQKAVLESESLTQKQALENNVIDLVATDKEELLAAIHSKVIKLPQSEITLATEEAVLITYEPQTRLKILNALANPAVIYLLVLGIIAGVYLEISHPGTIVPGILAGVCLVLALFATRALPINALGILLILLALALLVTEIYVTSYGFLTIAAIACFLMGSLFFFDPQEADVRVPLTLIIASTSALGLIALVITWSLVRTFKRTEVTGKEHLIGLTARVEDSIEPNKTGKIFVLGEYWNAVANERIEPGATVKIREVKGLTVVVNPEKNK